MKTVLFVCTGNIFRSMTAEHCLRHALGPSSPYRAASAGTVAIMQPMADFIRNRLLHLGVDPSAHLQRKLSREILEESDLVVAMGCDHQEFIRSNFGLDAYLFNRICFGRDEPVLDISEVLPMNWETDMSAACKYGESVVEYIYRAMPAFISNMEGFIEGAV